MLILTRLESINPVVIEDTDIPKYAGGVYVQVDYQQGDKQPAFEYSLPVDCTELYPDLDEDLQQLF